MPPRKNTRSRADKATPSSSGARSKASIASIFANVDANDTEEVKQPVEDKREVAPTAPQNDDPSTYAFPMNYVFTAQDFLNDNLDLCKFVQLLIIAYIAEVIFLNYNELFWEKYPIIGFNLFGIGLALILTYQAQWKKHDGDPKKFTKPELPEFNHIYSVFIPLCIAFISNLDLLLVNLSLNNFILDNLHPLPKFLSAILYFQVYNEDTSMSTVTMVGIIVTHFLLQYVIGLSNEGTNETLTEVSKEVIEQDDSINLDLVEKKNKKYESGTNNTLNKSEIQLLCTMTVNLLFGLPELNVYNLPLYILQKLVISLIISLFFAYPIFKFYENKKLNLIAALTVAVFSGFFVVLTNYQLAPIVSKPSAIVWLWEFITESSERLNILAAWVALLSLTIPTIFIKSELLSLNSRRKIWHYILLVMIAYPSLPKQPVFTIISLLGSITIFILLEIVRYNKFTIVGEWLYDQLVIFQDFKDLKGPLNLSYIFLIIGVSLPIVFDYCLKQELSCKSFIGIISLGVGDSFASIIGKKYGSFKWKGSPKSVQGTVAFVVFSFLGFFAIDQFILTQRVENWENVLVSCILGGVLEGVSNLNDNLLIPCIMFISLQMLEKT